MILFGVLGGFHHGTVHGVLAGFILLIEWDGVIRRGPRAIMFGGAILGGQAGITLGDQAGTMVQVTGCGDLHQALM